MADELAINVTETSWASVDYCLAAHLKNMKIKQIQNLDQDELVTGKTCHLPILRLPEGPRDRAIADFR